MTSSIAGPRRSRDCILYAVLPPAVWICQRREDISLLAHHFLSLRARRGQRCKRITPGALAALGRYDWPGNVRELENMIERISVLSADDVVREADLPPEIIGQPAMHDFLSRISERRKTGEQVMIEEALRHTGGDKAKAARHIGWNRQKLYRRMKAYSIPTSFGIAA